MDAAPPLRILEEALIDQAKAIQTAPVPAGRSVVYWMRMTDLRGEPAILLMNHGASIDASFTVKDNRAMLAASKQAQKDGVPLVVVAAIVPSEYKAHDRGPRRIDFMLRNLRSVKVGRPLA